MPDNRRRAGRGLDVQVTIPAIKIPQPDGSILFKPGKPIVTPQFVNTRQAAAMLGFSQRHIETQCSLGQFESAFKPGGRARSSWRISREEVIARLEPGRDI